MKSNMPFTRLCKEQNIPAEMNNLQTANKSLRVALNSLLTVLTLAGVYYIYYKQVTIEKENKKSLPKKG